MFTMIHVVEWKTLEDWTDYQSPPPNCNKSYDAWNWTDNETKMLLTSTMDGYMTKTKKLVSTIRHL